MKEPFYKFKGSAGHDIKIKQLTGLDMFDIMCESKGNQDKMQELLLVKGVTVNGNPADRTQLILISASDLVEAMDALGRQVQKLNLL